jgi:hypothetical protein
MKSDVDRTQLLNLSLEGREYRLDVGADTAITPASFNKCLMTQPALLGFYAGLYRTAERVVAKRELDLDIWMSEKRNTIRASMAVTGEKFTAVMVDDRVKVDLEYRVLAEQVAEDVYKRDMLRAVVDALRDRTPMLVQIGARMRDQLKIGIEEADELSVQDREFQAREFARTHGRR